MLTNDRHVEDLPESTGCGPLITSVDVVARPLRQQVFERIRATGGIPRVDLAKRLEISPGTVTALTADLIDAGLIHENHASRRETESARGRPPVSLCVSPKAGYVAGIKLSDQAHTAVVLDFAGNRVAHANLTGKTSMQTGAELADAAHAVLTLALKRTDIGMDDLLSVGLGVPGVVDHTAGVLSWSPLVSDRNIGLRDLLHDRTGRPICIDNDTNLVTLAELWFGAGRSLPEFVVVTIEHGVGMGLVLDHQLYRGALGLGMELGHTKVQLDGALCRCGQRGCLEAYVADYALVREASTALNWTNGGAASHQVLLENLYRDAKLGNQAAQAIFHRAGRYLSVGLANVVNILDPSLILLSGERMQYDYLYAEEVLADVAQLTLEKGRPAPAIEIHAWGDLVWAQGAAALALDHATPAAMATVGA